ncbi:hypothetical protein KIN20_011795 [Parelaphostrongylus tenuis]|uniref:Uncharacterized protein n=1 Tax=Parelaphostrongylus tenuis TaxID=148309 RepID=A0AAD5N0K4_PARTN|nr:hypothetical protein KIN20_011795 [Parelaphostrongylus tenuis]
MISTRKRLHGLKSVVIMQDRVLTNHHRMNAETMRIDDPTEEWGKARWTDSVQDCDTFVQLALGESVILD